MGFDATKSGVRSDINITPLVDVVLVLLIIFMVAANWAASTVWWEGRRSRNFSAYFRLWSFAREKLKRRSAITLSE